MTTMTIVNRNKMAWLLVAAMAGTVSLPGTSRASDNPNPIEVGGFLGYHVYSSTNLLGRREEDPDSTSLNSSIVMGIRVGYNLIPQLALETELAVIPTETQGSPASTMTGATATPDPAKTQVLAFSMRGHLVWHILTGRVRPFILVGGGFMSSVPSNSTILQQDTDLMFHAGVGLKVRVGEAWGLRLDGRVYFPPDSRYALVTEDYEVTLGLYGAFGSPPKPTAPIDTDHDGVVDADDKCPRDPGIKENAGCPDADADHDGVVDRLDKCLAEAGPLDNAGCPDVDTDKDGLVDRLDKCPAEAGPPDGGGCAPKDSDGDGLLDGADKCPTEKGLAENQGCPDVDSDKDGVVDRLDKCPAEAGPGDNNGCPIPKALAAFTGTIDGIVFKNNAAALMPKSLPVLDAAAQVLVEHPTVRVEISGHTDNKGNHDKNVKLSQARARTVKGYLVKKGVAWGRLVAAGFGPDKPIADNRTDKGRVKNRRVEFHLIPDALAPAPAGGSAPLEGPPAPVTAAPVGATAK